MPSGERTDVNETDILLFWFGHVPGRFIDARGTLQIIRRLPLWAGNWGRYLWDVDADIRQRFADAHTRASQGEFAGWLSSPVGRLALVLVLDQFSRNIHRGSAAAFAHDHKVIKMALDALDLGEDKLFYPVARSFFYLPLVHQEDPACQRRAVGLYRELVRQATGVEKVILSLEYVSAVRHSQMIHRFGRFPYRNNVLGRRSTREEARFLRQPFSHF